MNADRWCGFSLRESLVAGFCATFIVLSELFLRIPLHIPGHRVLPLAFFLLLGRACLKPKWSASAISLIAGLVSLCLGREEFLQIFKYLAAGGMIDTVALLLPAVTRSLPLGALAGALVGAAWMPAALLVDRLSGMDLGMALRHTLLKLASAALFGAVGGAMAPAVARRLQASGVVPARCAATPRSEPPSA
jgi:hypothetical protein